VSSKSNEGDPVKVSLDEWQVEAVSVDEWVVGELPSPEGVEKTVDDDATVLEDHTLFKNEDESGDFDEDQRVELISLADWCDSDVESPLKVSGPDVDAPLGLNEPDTESEMSSVLGEVKTDPPLDKSESERDMDVPVEGVASVSEVDDEDDIKTIAFVPEEDELQLAYKAIEEDGDGRTEEGFGDEDLSLVEPEFETVADSVWEEDAPTEFDPSSLIEKEMLDDGDLDELNRMNDSNGLSLDEVEDDLVLSNQAPPNSPVSPEPFVVAVADDEQGDAFEAQGASVPSELVFEQVNVDSNLDGERGSSWETVQTMRPITLELADLAENHIRPRDAFDQGLVRLTEEDLAIHHRFVIELDDVFFVENKIDRNADGLILLKASDLVNETKSTASGKIRSKKSASPKASAVRERCGEQMFVKYCLLAMPLLLLGSAIGFHFKYSWVTISEQQYEAQRSRLSGSEWWLNKCFRFRTEDSSMRWFGRQQLRSSSYDRIKKEGALTWMFYTDSGSEDVGDVLEIE
jgi:hypothetical protein